MRPFCYVVVALGQTLTREVHMVKRMVAEFAGTFWIVLGGCGTAVLAGEYVGFLGIALAFGLTVVTMAYAVGHISGATSIRRSPSGCGWADAFPASRWAPTWSLRSWAP